MTTPDVEYSYLEPQMIKDLIEVMRTREPPLDDKSQGFLDSCLERAEQYNKVRFSPLQRKWLTNLAEKRQLSVPWEGTEVDLFNRPAPQELDDEVPF